MKRFIYITVVLMFMLIFIGCATTTSEQRQEGSDLASSVGTKSFVGETHTGGRDLGFHIAAY
jgi:hypothetical protein